jgi:hypothetical protein
VQLRGRRSNPTQQPNRPPSSGSISCRLIRESCLTAPSRWRAKFGRACSVVASVDTRPRDVKDAALGAGAPLSASPPSRTDRPVRRTPRGRRGCNRRAIRSARSRQLRDLGGRVRWHYRAFHRSPEHPDHQCIAARFTSIEARHRSPPLVLSHLGRNSDFRPWPRRSCEGISARTPGADPAGAGSGGIRGRREGWAVRPAAQVRPRRYSVGV